MVDGNPPAEEWRNIPGHPGYDVSSRGRVRSWKGRGQTPLVLKPWTDPAGYVKAGLGKKSRYIHQLVAEAFIGPRPDGYEVDHINAVRGDNRAENLQYLTRAENTAKRVFELREKCLAGHSMSGDNLYVKPNGDRQCRTCANARVQALRDGIDGKPECAEDGCDRVSYTGPRSAHPGLCEMHYQRARKAEKRGSRA